MDEVNEFCSLPPPKNKKTKNGAVSVLRVQTGTIVCCRCCIWDNTSCCTLAIMMSWCEGVMIPSLSISLWGHKKNNNKKQGCGQKTKATTTTPKKGKKQALFFSVYRKWQTHSSWGTQQLIANCFFKETAEAPCEQLMTKPSSQFCNGRCQWGQILNNWHLCATEVHR